MTQIVKATEVIGGDPDEARGEIRRKKRKEPRIKVGGGGRAAVGHENWRNTSLIAKATTALIIRIGTCNTSLNTRIICDSHICPNTKKHPPLITVTMTTKRPPLITVTTQKLGPGFIFLRRTINPAYQIPQCLITHRLYLSPTRLISTTPDMDGPTGSKRFSRLNRRFR